MKHVSVPIQSHIDARGSIVTFTLITSWFNLTTTASDIEHIDNILFISSDLIQTDYTPDGNHGGTGLDQYLAGDHPGTGPSVLQEGDTVTGNNDTMNDAVRTRRILKNDWTNLRNRIMAEQRAFTKMAKICQFVWIISIKVLILTVIALLIFGMSMYVYFTGLSLNVFVMPYGKPTALFRTNKI